MIRVGTSGWVYDDWRGRFYPANLSKKNWLHYYSRHFDTVELNATTYRLPKENQIQTWCETVPPQFLYTVKLSRLITHRKSLPVRVDEFVDNYMQRIACFGSRAAQLLVQFPPFLKRDDTHLEKFLDKLPKHNRYVVEFRSKTWMNEVVFEMLRERGVAFCIHDYPGFRTGDVVTSNDLAYVRLHGYEGLYVGNYPHRSLEHWARRIRKVSEKARQVFVYFNNDTRAAAPHDAATLRALLDATF